MECDKEFCILLIEIQIKVLEDLDNKNISYKDAIQGLKESLEKIKTI